MSSIVEWAGVSRRFAGNPEVVALEPTDYSISAGDFHAIVGKSGSGKSTMLNLLGLLDTPSQGSYKFLGQRTDSMSDRERADVRLVAISYVFQSFYLIDKRDVLANVSLPLMYRGVPLEDRRSAASKAVNNVGLGHRKKADVSTLSGGERQRVAIARAMVGEPKLLLCDEPTGNLDASNAAQVLDLISDINSRGTAVIIVTHDPAAAKRADTQWTLNTGELCKETP